MIIAILSAVVCLMITIVLFTPSFRHIGVLRPIALFFMFEGVWILVDYLVTRISPGNEATQWVHYAGIIIFGGYMIVCLIYSRPKKKTSEKRHAKDNKSKSKHIGIDDRPQ